MNGRIKRSHFYKKICGLLLCSILITEMDLNVFAKQAVISANSVSDSTIISETVPEPTPVPEPAPFPEPTPISENEVISDDNIISENESTPIEEDSLSQNVISQNEFDVDLKNDMSYGYFTYQMSAYNSPSIKITGYTGYESFVEIPEEISGYKVTAISYCAFEDNIAIHSVSIPDTVVRIYERAFSGCSNLEGFNWPQDLSYADSSIFSGCTSLKSVTVPYIASSGGYIFYKCTGINEVTFTDDCTYIPQKMFSGCTSLTTIDLNNVQSISGFAFEDCTSLNEIEFHKTLPIQLGSGVFRNTDFTNIVIPSNVTFNGTSIFEDCKELLAASSGASGNYQWCFDGCDKLSVVTISGNMKYDPENGYNNDGIFGNLKSLQKVSLSNAIGIGKECFSGCVSLNQIELPANLVHIGSMAFKDCKSLKEIELPYGLTSIDQRAFQNCKSLQEVVLPSTLTELGEYTTAALVDEGGVFLNCTSLKKVALGTATNIRMDTFKNCSSLEEVVWSDEITYVGTSAFEGCESLKSIEMTGNLEEIGVDSFVNCTSLTEVIMPDVVTTIKDSAFYGCSSLNKVKFSEQLCEIGNNAFSRCYSLSDIELPDYLCTIEDYAFEYCNLSKVTVPYGVTTIENGAFMGGYDPYSENEERLYNQITEITIPSTVTNLSNYILQDDLEVTVYGVKGSAAEAFANNHETYTFVEYEEAYNPRMHEVSKYNFSVAVVNAKGNPVKGAELDFGPNYESVVTDTSGRADLVFVSEDTNVDVTISHPLFIEQEEKCDISSGGFKKFVLQNSASGEATINSCYLIAKDSPGYIGKDINLLTNEVFVNADEATSTIKFEVNASRNGSSYTIAAYNLLINGAVAATTSDGIFTYDFSGCSRGDVIEVAIVTSNGINLAKRKLEISIVPKNYYKSFKDKKNLTLDAGGSTNFGGDTLVLGGDYFGLDWGESAPLLIDIDNQGNVKLSFNISTDVLNAFSDDDDIWRQKAMTSDENIFKQMQLTDEFNSSTKGEMGLGTFSADVSIAGYGEGKIKNGDLIADMKFIYSVKGGYEKTQKFVIPAKVKIPAYVTWGVDVYGKGIINAKVGINQTGKFVVMSTDGSTIIGIEGYIEGKAGTKEGFNIGAEGSLKAEYSDSLVAGNSKNIKLNADLFLTAKLFGSRVGELPIIQKEWNFPVNRSYASYSSSNAALYGASATDAVHANSLGSDNSVTIPSDCTQEAIDFAKLTNYKLIECNGRKYIFYLYSENDEQELQLAYSTLNAGQWSAPTLLQNDGSADYEYSLITNDNQIYVVWENNTTDLNYFDDNIVCEICAAKISTDTGTISLMNVPNNNHGRIVSLLVAASGDRIYTYWLENDANNFLGTTGNNQLYYAELNQEGAEPELLETYSCAISSFTTGVFDGKLYLIVAESDNQKINYVDLDGNSSTRENNAQKAKSVTLDGTETLFWVDGNQLMYSNSLDGTPTSFPLEKCSVYSDYTIAAQGNSATVFWNDGYISEQKDVIYAMDYENGVWGEPYTFQEADGIISHLSAYITESGKRVCTFMLSAGTAENDETVLLSTEKGKYDSLKFDEIQINTGLSDNKVPIHLSVKNAGNQDKTGFSLKLCQSDETLYEKAFNDITVPAGSVYEVALTDVELSGITQLGEYQLQLYTSNGTEDTYNFMLGHPDIDLQVESMTAHECVLLDLILENKGVSSANTTIKFYGDDSNTSLPIYEYSCGELSAGERYILSIDTNKLPNCHQYSTLYIEAECQETERVTINNFAIVSLSPDEFYASDDILIEEIVFDEPGYFVNEGESISISADYLPANNTIRDNGYWESSDETIARVDQTGTVTGVTSYEEYVTITHSIGNIKKSCSVGVNVSEIEPPTYTDPMLDLTTESYISFKPRTQGSTIYYKIDDGDFMKYTAPFQLEAGHHSVSLYAMAKGLGESNTINIGYSIRTPLIRKIEFIPSSITIGLGEMVSMNAKILPEACKDNDLSWRSVNQSIAFVSSCSGSSCDIVANRVGTTTIYASALDGSGVEASCTVTVVNEVSVNSIEKLQSPHPYKNNMNSTYVYTDKPSDRLAVIFDEETCTEENYDFINIYDSDNYFVGKFTGNELSGKCVVVSGNTVKINITSDGYETDYGFKVKKIIPLSDQDQVVEQINFPNEKIYVKKNENHSISFDVIPNDADRSNMVIDIADSNIAELNNGIITGKQNGKTNLSISVNDIVGAQASCEVIVPYNIDYNLDGGRNHVSNLNYYYDETMELCAPEKEGYTFAGWYLDEGLVKQIYEVNDTMHGDITLYAKWIDNTNYSIQLNESLVSMIPNETKQLVANVSPRAAAVSWKSLNEDVAIVTEGGLITAVGEGTTTIIASVNNASTKCTVNVTPEVLTEQENPLEIEIDSHTVGMGNSISYKVFCGDLELHNKDLVWKFYSDDTKSQSLTSENDMTGATVIKGSDGKTILSMSEGQIHALGLSEQKEAYLEASYHEESAICQVRVIVPAEQVELVTTEGMKLEHSEIGINETLTVSAKISPSNVDDSMKNIQWVSSNPLVASIGADGPISATIIGMDSGIADISAITESGVKDTIQIRVIGHSTVNEMKADAEKIVLFVNGSEEENAMCKAKSILHIQARDVSGNIIPKEETDFIYQSSNTDIAVVHKNEDGSCTISAQDCGTAVITALDQHGSNHFAYTTVIVKKCVESIDTNLLSDTLLLQNKKSFMIKASVAPLDAANKELVWQIKDGSATNIVKIGKNGTINAQNVGETIIQIDNPESGTCKELRIKVFDATIAEYKTNTVAISCDSMSTQGVINLVPACINKPADSILLNAIAKNNSGELLKDEHERGFVWQSTAPKVATVDANGQVTAIAKGNAKIRATVNDGSNKYAEVSVKVSGPVVGLSLNKDKMLLKPGQSEKLVSKISPTNADNKKIIWSIESDDFSISEKLITVDQNGKVTVAKKKADGGEIPSGTKATVIAKCAYDETILSTAEVEIISVKASKISLDSSKLYIERDGSSEETKVLTATVLPNNSDVAQMDLVWSSSNALVATVLPDGPNATKGIVTTTGFGTTVITAMTADKVLKATCLITVSPINKDYKLSAVTTQQYLQIFENDIKSNCNVRVKDQFSNIIPADLFDYQSDKPEIAIVDQYGNVTPNPAWAKAGTATITASLKGDPQKRAVKFKVTLAKEKQVETIELSSQEDLVRTYQKGDVLHLSAHVFDSYYNEMSTKLKWSLSDTSLAKLVVAKDGKSSTITIAKEGKFSVICQAQDKLQCKKAVYIETMTGNPIVGNTKIVLNKKEDTGKSSCFTILETNGSSIVFDENMTAESTRITKVLYKKKVIAEENGLNDNLLEHYRLTQNADSSYSVMIHNDSKPNYLNELGTGAYEVTLDVVTDAIQPLVDLGIEDGEARHHNTVKLSLTLIDTIPALTLNDATMNLFYGDTSRGTEIVFKKAAAPATSMTAVSNQATDFDQYFMFEQDPNTGKWSLKFKNSNAYEQYLTLNKKSIVGEIEVKMEGYLPIVTKIKVNTPTTKPVFVEQKPTLVLDALYLSSDLDSKKAYTYLIDSKTKEPLSSYDIIAQSEPKLLIEKCDNGMLSVMVPAGTDIVNNKTYTSNITIRDHSNVNESEWATPIIISLKVKVCTSSLPKITMGNPKITLNRAAIDEGIETSLKINCDNLEIRNSGLWSVEKYNKATKEYEACDDLILRYYDGNLMIKLSENSNLGVGTYKFKIYNMYDADGYYFIGTDMNISIIDKQPSAKIVTSGKIDLLNRNQALTANVTFANVTGNLSGISMTSSDYYAVQTDNKSFVIRLRKDAKVSTAKVTIPVRLTLEGGTVIDTTVAFKPSQSLPKAKSIVTKNLFKSSENRFISYDIASVLPVGVMIDHITAVSIPSGISATTSQGMLTMGLTDSTIKQGTYYVTINCYLSGAEKLFGYPYGKPVVIKVPVKIVE